jgi:hypothetical protein
VPSGPPPAYVQHADFRRWVVVNPGGLALRLMGLGFFGLPLAASLTLSRSRDMSFEQMGELATRLRDIGVAFSHGRDWAPSEIVADLRERGLMRGPFTMIAWKGPDDWELREL